VTTRPLFIGLLLPALIGCPARPVTVEATLYFADRDLRYLVPVTRPVKSTLPDLPANLMAHLQEPPQGLTSVLPNGTVVQSVERQQDTVTVSLVPPKTGLQGAAMVQEAIALSLVGVDGIRDVRVKGLPKGEDTLDFSQPTGRPDHPNKWLEAGEADAAWVTVCWQTNDHRFLVPVSVPAASDSVAERLVVWQRGPTGGRQPLFDGLWPATLPLTLAGREGTTVTVRLPGSLPGSLDKRWRPALAWTLTEAVGVEHLRLSGNSEGKDAAADGAVGRPLALNVESHS
jgi:hypothetical protein